MTTGSLNAPADLSPWVLRVVRLGFLAKGLIYSLIGILAFRLAIGLRGGRLVDSSGVLRTLLGQPFGLIMLAIISIGILGYAAYYVCEASWTPATAAMAQWLDQTVADDHQGRCLRHHRDRSAAPVGGRSRARRRT